MKRTGVFFDQIEMVRIEIFRYINCRATELRIDIDLKFFIIGKDSEFLKIYLFFATSESDFVISVMVESKPVSDGIFRTTALLRRSLFFLFNFKNI